MKKKTMKMVRKKIKRIVTMKMEKQFVYLPG